MWSITIYILSENIFKLSYKSRYFVLNYEIIQEFVTIKPRQLL